MIAGLLLAGALTAQAAEDPVVIGVFVGNDRGSETQAPLRFASADARKMRDLFVRHGSIAPADAVLLIDQPRRNVESALVMARQRLADAEAKGLQTQLVFYYSGHGDEGGLNLGNTVVRHEDLRAWLDQSGADVRIALLDACRSGGAVRQKGGVRGASYSFAVAVENVQGTAILTSSAASEFAQESDELGGGFFTHYVHTALSGAADTDGDGDVTLAETYAYVHTETVFRTRDTPGTQTPSFEWDLSGTGAVRLTRLADADAWLDFPGGLDGIYAVWDETRKRYVGEVSGDQPASLALPHGFYVVQQRMPGWVDEADYHLGRGERETVDLADFASVAYSETESRGDLKKQARRAALPDTILFLSAGGRGFGPGSLYDLQYVPEHPVAGFEVRQGLPYELYVSVDALGGQATDRLVFDEIAATDIVVGSRSVGATFGYAPGVCAWEACFDFGIGVRAEAVTFWRSFPHGEDDRQASGGAAPGGQVWLGFHYRRVYADLGLNLMILPVTFDAQPRSPGYREGLLRVGFALK